MSVAFPLTPAPGAFAIITGSTRGNVYVDGETPTFTFNKAVTGTWTVRDYYGTIITTGALAAVSGITPTAPVGGWPRGWYRLYLTGSTNDAVFGYSLGVTNFCVVANDSRFIRPANRSVDPSPGGEGPALALKGFLGIGTSRIQIADAAAPTVGYDALPNAKTCLLVSNLYWTTGAGYIGPDSSRPRNSYVSFPNTAVDHVVFQVAFVDRLMFAYASGAVAAAGPIQISTASGTSSGIKFTLAQITNFLAANDASFETSAPGNWAAIGTNPPTLAQSAVRAQDGTKSMLVTWAGTGGGTYPAARINNITFISGQTYTYSAYVYVPTGSPNVLLSVQGIADSATVTAKDAWTRVSVTFTAPSTGTQNLVLYPANSTTAGTVYLDAVQVESGSSATTFTTASGATEVFDNIVGTVTEVIQALASSALVACYRPDDGSVSGSVTSGLAGTLTNAKYLGVKQVVTECSVAPYSCLWYEGPQNEPDIRKNPVRYAHDALMFRDAVKAGNAAAKVMGPSLVDISVAQGYPDLTNNASGGGAALYRYLVGGIPAGGTGVGTVAANDGPDRAAKNYLDGLMTHVYNFCVTDLNSAIYQLDIFTQILVAAGVGNLPRFQGELGVITPVYGIYHPRRARWQMLHHLLLGRYGFPMERNTLWYDESHGFWGFPGWWENSDQSINPHALMLRVMAEEIYGRPFTSTVDFGTGVGNKMFVGNLYTGANGTSVIGMVAASHLDNATVVLQLTGSLPGSITWRTGLGVTASVAVGTDGRITVPIAGEPTWVELPAGVTATVHTFLGLLNKNRENLAGRNSWASFDGVAGERKAVNGTWQTIYNGSTDEITHTAAPANYTILLENTHPVTDVVVFSGMAWQAQSVLVDFDVQTSANGGGSWTTQATYTKTPSSFVHGTDSNNTGTQRDTYWDEQWIIPIHLPAMVSCNAIRLVVRATSKGGEPNDIDPAIMGQGDSNQWVVLTEVYVLGDPTN